MFISGGVWLTWRTSCR
jgi:hypothetical protein